MPSRAFRIFIWSTIAFQFGLMAVLAVLIVLTDRAAQYPAAAVLSAMVGVLETLVFPIVGALIFSRRPEHPIGWLFSVSQVGWVLNNLANGFGMFALQVHRDLLPVANWVVWFYTWPGYLSEALFVYLVLLFPDGRLPSSRWRWLVWLTAAFGIFGMLVSGFAPGPVDSSGGLPYNNPFGLTLPGLGGLLAWANGFTQLLLTALIPVAAVSLVLRFRSARGQTRLQLKWLTVSIVFSAVMVVLAMILWSTFQTAASTPFWAMALEQLAIFSLALIPVSAGIAILRYHLYEIDRIINQALVYSSLTALLALVYFGLVLILQSLLGAITGEGHSTIATVLSTLAIASLFVPLRRRIQSVIDRRFYRRKYNAEIILGRLSSVLRSEVDLQVMSDQLISVVEEALQPNKTTLWIAKRGK